MTMPVDLIGGPMGGMTCDVPATTSGIPAEIQIARDVYYPTQIHDETGRWQAVWAGQRCSSCAVVSGHDPACPIPMIRGAR